MDNHTRTRRIKEGMANARARGKTIGNPAINAARKLANAARTHAADERARRLAVPIKQARVAGAVEMNEIAEWLNARSEPAPRGGPWSSGSVYRLIMRAISLRCLFTKPRSKPDAARAASPVRLATRAAKYDVYEKRRLRRKARRQGQNPEA